MTQSRRYIQTLHNGVHLEIIVYADRSVEMGLRYLDGEYVPRRGDHQTRDDAAFSLTLARTSQHPLVRENI